MENFEAKKKTKTLLEKLYGKFMIFFGPKVNEKVFDKFPHIFSLEFSRLFGLTTTVLFFFICLLSIGDST